MAHSGCRFIRAHPQPTVSDAAMKRSAFAPKDTFQTARSTTLAACRT